MSRRLVRRTVIGVAAVLVLVLVAVVVTGTVLVRRPLPTHSGSLTISGLDDVVTIARDARDVPTITATSAHDLFLAQGYTDAQDRFFLMDYRRHVASGTLSALVGADDAALRADKVIRTFGWRQVAEQEWEILKPATRQYLQAYADGVNAYLAGRSPSQIAVEYTILGLHVDVSAPARWTPVDSLVWLKAMAWDLRANYDDELGRAESYATLRDVTKVDELFPAYPESVNAPIVTHAAAPTATVSTQGASYDLGDATVQRAFTAASTALAAVPHLVGDGDGVGSNSWVVSGAHTASGKPLLANDPHLSLSQPGVWSQVGLRCAQVSADCPFAVAGYSLAGLPGVIIGHDQKLAWGLTNLGADVTDFYLERTVGTDVVVDGATVPMTLRKETIKVAGGTPVTITVRSTRHGPIVSDVLDVGDVGSAPVGATGRSYAVSLDWTALTPGHTADAIFALDRAADAADVQAAAAAFDVPSQNILFATTDGHIGYQAPGRVPVRADVVGSPLPSDGTWPQPGWDTAYDWKGYVDPSAMPRELDPAEGFIVAANQEAMPAGQGPYLTSDWDYGFRAQRIRDLLTAKIAKGTVDMADMQQIALDKQSAAAEVLVPALLTLDIGTGFDADGQKLLRTWDRQMDAGSSAAMYFAAVWKNVLAQTFSDELPDEAALTGDSRSIELVREIIDQPDSPWWDDRATPRVVEGRDQVLSQAMIDARKQLTAQLGRDPKTWAWGTLHRAAPRHPVLGGDGVPALVRWWVNPAPRAVGGGSSIVDATGWDASSDSYDAETGPSMRMVVDLSDLDSSTWVNLTGTSGHPASDHYDDQFAAWADGTYFAWPYTPAAVTADAVVTLTLSP